jgi:hypothetical protein
LAIALPWLGERESQRGLAVVEGEDLGGVLRDVADLAVCGPAVYCACAAAVNVAAPMSVRSHWLYHAVADAARAVLF